MDETSNDPSQGGAGAWALSRLGFAIDTYVDRQINGPQALANSASYGVDQNGQLYQMGQPTRATVQSIGGPAGALGGGNGMLLLLALGAFLMMNR